MFKFTGFVFTFILFLFEFSPMNPRASNLRGHVPSNYGSNIPRDNLPTQSLARQALNYSNLLAEKDRRINDYENRIHQLQQKLRNQGSQVPAVQLAIPIVGPGISFQNQNQRYPIQIIVAGVSNIKAANPFILNRDLPLDMKLMHSIRDQRQNGENGRHQESIIGCVIPISRQIGRLFDGNKVFFSQKLGIKDDQRGDNVRDYNKYKQNTTQQRKIREKLQKSPQAHMIEGFLYISDQSQGRAEGEIDYLNLLNEKQYQLIECFKKIQNLERKIKGVEKRQIQYENKIIKLQDEIKNKASIIELKERRLTEETVTNGQLSNLLLEVKKKAQSKIPSDQIVSLFKQSKSNIALSQVREYSQKLIDSGGNFLAKNQVIKLVKQLDKATNVQGSQNMQNVEETVEGWILGLPSSSSLKKKLQKGEQNTQLEEEIKKMKNKLSYASDIYKNQVSKIKKENPFVHLNVNEDILSILSTKDSNVTKIDNILEIQKSVVKTIQVPVQDVNTKTLILLFANQLKRLHTKYPKLYGQMDSRLTEYFSNQLIHVIESDDIDRVVQVVKYVPQVVKVENVYAYSSEKTRKVQFHLRVLIKALLEQLQKIKQKTGMTLEMDQGVFEMVRQQIIGVVNVDDILKVFQVNQKIVEVQKIVERIVQRVVQVPRNVETIITNQKPVEIKRTEVLENVVHVPLEVPNTKTLVEQILVSVPRKVQVPVKVPQIVQRVVELVKQVPKVVTVDRMVEVIVEKEVIVPMPEMIREIEVVHEIPVEIIVQKIVIQERTKQIPKEVPPVIIERIVPVVEEVLQIVEVPHYIDRVQYQTLTEVKNHIQKVYETVHLETQRTIPVQVRHEQIVQVPRIVEKVIGLVTQQEIPIEVQIKVEKPLYRDRIKEVQIEKPIFLQKEKVRQIDRYVQVPVIEEKVREEKVFIKEPYLQTIKETIHQQVKVQKPFIIYQDKIIEVDKIINHYATQEKPVYITTEKIIEIIKRQDKIMTVPMFREKIIEKMVEVPRVVEVQKIVQKIVVVPRIVQKIVTVTKEVEVIVQKIIYEEKLIQVQRIVEKPVITEVFINVDVPRNIYIEIEKQVIVPEQIMVTNTIEKQTEKIKQVFQERLVIEKKQVPKLLQVEKIVCLNQQVARFIQKPIVVPIEIEIPVDLIIQKMVPINRTIKELVVQPQIHEKIVTIQSQVIKPVQCETIVEKLKIEKQYVQIDKISHHIQDRYKEIQVDRIIPLNREVIKEIEVMNQNRVYLYQTIQKIKVIDRDVLKPIRVPQIYQLKELIPRIVQIPKYFQRLVEKIVEIPIIMERLKQIEVKTQKIVQINTTETNVLEVQRKIQKEVLIERLVKATDRINHVEQVFQYFQLHSEKNVPVLIVNQKIIEVPVVMENIVQRIILMPQVLEVLKYVHEVVEQETLGSPFDAEKGTQQNKYTFLGRNVQTQMERLLIQLKKMKSNPSLKLQIETIQKFLSQFEKFILYPRIQQVIRQRPVQTIIQKQRLVKLPTQGGEALARNILIEKLIIQLKRIKKTNPQIRLNLDEDIAEIFFIDEGGDPSRSKLTERVKKFSDSVEKAFNLKGGWNKQQQQLLKEFLNERFQIAETVRNMNTQLQKTQLTSEKRKQQLLQVKEQRDRLINMMKSLHENLNKIDNQGERANASQNINNILKDFFTIIIGQKINPNTFFLGVTDFSGLRSNSIIREKDLQIQKLRDLLLGANKTSKVQYSNNSDIQGYKSRILLLERENSRLRETPTFNQSSQGKSQFLQLEREIERLKKIIQKKDRDISNYQNRILLLEIEIDRLRVIQKEHEKCSANHSQLAKLLAANRLLQEQNKELQQRITKMTKNMNSPNTRHGYSTGIISPRSNIQDKKSSDSKHDSESAESNYGEHFNDYVVIEDPHSVGMVKSLNVGKTQTQYTVRTNIKYQYQDNKQLDKKDKNQRNYQERYNTNTNIYKMKTDNQGNYGNNLDPYNDVKQSKYRKEEEDARRRQYGSNQGNPTESKMSQSKIGNVKGNTATYQSGSYQTATYQSGLSGSGSKIQSLQPKYRKNP